MVRAAERRIGEFNAQDVANTAWAFATVTRPDEKVFMALAGATEHCIGEFTPQELAVAERAMGNVAQALMTRNSSYNAYDYYLERYRLDNFNSDRIAAVGLFALTFPVHPNASAWLQHASAELTWQLTNNLMADGAWPGANTHRHAR